MLSVFCVILLFGFFFFKQKTAYEIMPSLVGSEMCIRDSVSGIWGGKYAGALLDVDDVAGVVHVSGLVERPADVGTTTRRVFVAVNGRAVRDNGIVRAAEAAYRSTIAAGRRPSVFLNVRLPADTVDVNVHPAKAEVRFRD